MVTPARTEMAIEGEVTATAAFVRLEPPHVVSSIQLQPESLTENCVRTETSLGIKRKFEDGPGKTEASNNNLLGSQAPVYPSQIPAESEPIVLSPEQSKVLDMVRQGKNVFFTGPAGTGKSVLLREIVKMLRERGTKVAITATTGVAGVNIGGSTIHSFAGIRLGKEDVDILVKRLRGTKKYRKRWRKTRVLIIDEVSMLDGKLFDKLEEIARSVRKRRNQRWRELKPFGGMQLVISGDFFQLPPVPEQSHHFRSTATFAFDADTWNACFKDGPVLLSKVFRQKNADFVDILHSMRTNSLNRSQIARLYSLSRPLYYDDGIEPSCLFPLRAEVDTLNRERLRTLTAEGLRYRAMDYAGYDVEGIKLTMEEATPLLDRLVAQEDITLKIGAQVMLIQNIEQGRLVNGSQGVIVDFMSVRDAKEKNISIAETAKKDQSFSPDSDTDDSEDDESVKKRYYPQVESSQFNSQQVQQDIEPASKKAKQEAKSFVTLPDLTQINKHGFSGTQVWPLVKFTSGDHLLCCAVDFTVEGFRGNVEAKRCQVPLILSWALSIHKSQGQTLERVYVDLNKIFETGQTYVALSRATSINHLQVMNFHPTKVRAHPRVVEWEKSWRGDLQLPQDELDEVAEDCPVEDEMDSQEAIAQYWDL